jgi:hypothetical protein
VHPHTPKKVLETQRRMGQIKLFQHVTLGRADRHTMATATDINRNANLGDNHDRDSS